MEPTKEIRMLTGEQLAGLLVAVFWAILVCFLAYALLKLARLITEATAPGLMPRLRAVSRWLRRKVHFSRRISRMFRMGSRSVAIALLGTDVAKDTMAEPDAQRRPPGDHDAWNP